LKGDECILFHPAIYQSLFYLLNLMMEHVFALIYGDGKNVEPLNSQNPCSL